MADDEWRYYQRDGNGMVRQTTNETAKVSMAWIYTPEGMVLFGEEGPVTYLDCGSGGIYDWSTGLIFKGGRFFDPLTGIWISLISLIVWQSGRYANQTGLDRKRKKLLFLLFLTLSLFALSGVSLKNQHLAQRLNPAVHQHRCRQHQQTCQFQAHQPRLRRMCHKPLHLFHLLRRQYFNPQK